MQERPVHAMQRHPVEVPPHSLRVPRREHERLLSIRVLQSGGREELRGRVLGGVGPEIGVRTSAVGYGVVEPVQPAVVSGADGLSIAGTGEPALVPDEELVVDGGWIRALERLALGETGHPLGCPIGERELLAWRNRWKEMKVVIVLLRADGGQVDSVDNRRRMRGEVVLEAMPNCLKSVLALE